MTMLVFLLLKLPPTPSSSNFFELQGLEILPRWEVRTEGKGALQVRNTLHPPTWQVTWLKLPGAHGN